MTLQMRWLKSHSRKCDGSLVQQEFGSPVFHTLQFRTVKTWEGNENISVPLKPVWTEWENVEVQEER